MGHISLYRKYRPLNWEQIIGQNHIVRTIKNQISSNNISHAYLFTGSRGTGKTSSAKIFARAINCLNPIDGSPCNQCANCISILNETSFDVVELDAASNNSVNDIRTLIENISIPPMSGKYKVYIVDEVHMLSQQAFNAFLKTLEEPPEYVVFILATTEVHKIPNTILSRCMQFDFRLIPVNELTEIVTNIFDKENYKYEIEACRQIAIHGEGSARDTLSIADMCMAYSPQNLTYDDVLEVLGGSDFETLYIIAEAILNSNISRLLEQIDAIYHRGKGISTLNRELANFFKELITIKNVPSYAPFSNEQNQAALNLAKEHDNYKISRILEIIALIESNLRFSTQPKILFEANLIKASKLITSPNIEALNSRIESLEKQIKAFSKDNVEYFKKFLDNNNLISPLYLKNKESSLPKKKNNLKTNSNNDESPNKLDHNDDFDSEPFEYKDEDIQELPFEDEQNEAKNLPSSNKSSSNDGTEPKLPFEDRDEDAQELPFEDTKDNSVHNESSLSNDDSELKLPFEDRDEDAQELPFENELDNNDTFNSEIPFEDRDEDAQELPFSKEVDPDDDFDLETPFKVEKEFNESNIEVNEEPDINIEIEDSFSDDINEESYDDIEGDDSLENNEENITTSTTKNNDSLPFEDKEDNNEAKKLFDDLLDKYKDNVFVTRAFKQADKFELKNGVLTLKYMGINSLSYKRLQYQYKAELDEVIKEISPNTKIAFELIEENEDEGKLNQLELEEIKQLFGDNLIIKD
ncbi:MAG: DNA polymerase III subunit gamma/tau [Christensenellales bacterium]|jgi:DNA polymerase-3 subunit gamma/tau|nr:DNA polymerase III subunit gamma/tau [Clostridiales bacterium]